MATSLTSVSASLLWRQRLVMLRGLLVVLLSLLFAIAWSHSLSPLPVLTTLFWLTLLWLPSVLFMLTRRRSESSQRRLLLTDLMVDVLLFIGLIYQLGGAGNPIIFYLLLHVLIASLSLPTAWGATIALLSATGYAFSLSWHSAPMHHMHELHDISSAHGIGMWLVFVALALVFLILGQALQAASQRDRQQQATSLSLALQRERMYQIAADLADRAHELNTPLATLVLLTEEPPPDDAGELRQNWQQIQELSTRMAAILRQSLHNENPSAIPLSELVSSLRKSLRILAPTLEVRWQGRWDPLLEPAGHWQRILSNLGYNACDAGATLLEIRCERVEPNWLIQVTDNGPKGTKDDGGIRQGLGIGLALIETTLASIDGHLDILFDNQWTLARITIPIKEGSAL